MMVIQVFFSKFLLRIS